MQRLQPQVSQLSHRSLSTATVFAFTAVPVQQPVEAFVETTDAFAPEEQQPSFFGAAAAFAAFAALWQQLEAFSVDTTLAFDVTEQQLDDFSAATTEAFALVAAQQPSAC